MSTSDRSQTADAKARRAGTASLSGRASVHRIALVLLPLLALLPLEAAAASLDRLRETGEVRIGYRQDAAPFSYENAVGEAAGYSVDLCKAVAARLKDQLALDKITLRYVPVGAEDRFDALEDGRIDLLCGATTATLSRRERVDFSIATFVDGASVLFRDDGPDNFQALAGRKVGVRGATTTEEALRNTLEDLAIDAEIVAVSSHDDGLQKLEAGEIAAYFGDRAILLYLAGESDDPARLMLSERYYTVEPYALGLPRGDGAFRLAVDRALSRIYRSGAIEGIFGAAFGPKVEPSELVKALYVISALPE